MPNNANTVIAAIACCVDGALHGFVHSMELMIARNLFNDAASGIFKALDY